MATDGGAGHIIRERIHNSHQRDNVFMFYLWYWMRKVAFITAIASTFGLLSEPSTMLAGGTNPMELCQRPKPARPGDPTTQPFGTIDRATVSRHTAFPAQGCANRSPKGG